jgi:hypothetical protein
MADTANLGLRAELDRCLSPSTPTVGERVWCRPAEVMETGVACLASAH